MPSKTRSPETEWRTSEARAALHALYAEADALLAGVTCDASTDCCHFGRTGREPYPTAAESRELLHALASRGLQRKVGVAGGASAANAGRGRGLPIVHPRVVRDERRCPLLDVHGRCAVYASRPFGCRTFFCERAVGAPRGVRAAIARVGRAIADLSARVDPRDPGARPLTRVLALPARSSGASRT